MLGQAVNCQIWARPKRMQNVEHRCMARVSKAFGWFLVWCLTIVSIVFVYVCISVCIYVLHMFAFFVMSCFFGSSPPALPEIRPYPLDPSLKSNEKQRQFRSGNASLPDPSRCVKMCQVPSWDVRNMKDTTRYGTSGKGVRGRWAHSGRSNSSASCTARAAASDHALAIDEADEHKLFGCRTECWRLRHLLCYIFLSQPKQNPLKVPVTQTENTKEDDIGKLWKIMEDLWCSL